MNDDPYRYSDPAGSGEYPPSNPWAFALAVVLALGCLAWIVNAAVR